MSFIDPTGLTQAVSEIKAYCVDLFFPKSGGTVNGSVTSTGEVTATETVNNSTVTHNLTDKLDEDDYLAGMTWDYLEAHFTWDDLDGTNTSGSDTYTENLHLTKPGRLSTVAVNGDMDILDAKIGAVGSTDLQTQVTALSSTFFLANSRSVKIHGADTWVALVFNYTSDTSYPWRALIMNSTKIYYAKRQTEQGADTIIWQKTW